MLDQSWQAVLANSVRSSQELLERLELQNTSLVQQVSKDNDFPVLVPPTFLARMKIGDEHDPLLRQVLALQQEHEQIAGFVTDPLGEQAANISKGLVHKYQGRVLLIAAAGCAVNCRYCFRRHFPYADNRLGTKQWQQALSYVAADSSISEIILSGGDPLLLSDSSLQALLMQIKAIEHVKRLRIHSRLPVVIPQRLSLELAQSLAASGLHCSLVLHCNHPNELAPEHRSLLGQWRQLGITLLNQSVLLRGVNDDAAILCRLSEELFAYGVLPYYLHRLDRVQGASHFALAESEIGRIYQQMQASLPGYLLPRLVCEEAGKQSKTLLHPC